MTRNTGIAAIATLIMTYAMLHLGFRPDEHDVGTTVLTLLGGSAFLLFTVSLILTTRLRPVEDLFGGLDRMYRIHKVAAIVGTVTVAAHFLLVQSGGAGIEQVPEDRLVPSAPLGVAGLILLVLGMFLALNRRIRYSFWQPTHKVMAVMYLVVIVHFLTIPEALFVHAGPSGLILAVAAVIGVASGVYALLGMNRRTSRSFLVDEVHRHERVTEVALKPDLGATMPDFFPGQFAFVGLDGGPWMEAHPFTITSAPGEDRLRFAIKALGDWTRDLGAALRPGRQVVVRGPYGRFDTSRGGSKQVWVGGGIGITPFLSNLRAMTPSDPRQVMLFYAVRNQAEALFLDELSDLAERLDNVTLTVLFSDDGQRADFRTVQSALTAPVTDFTYYLCGPKGLTSTLSRSLRVNRVRGSDIHFEAFDFR